MVKRLKAAVKAGLHYAWWYPKQWLPVIKAGVPNLTSELSSYVRYVRRRSKKLARTLFHCMLRHGPGLDKQQLTLSRLTEIGSELYVITSAVLKADMMIKHNEDAKKVLHVVDNVFINSKEKIENNFSNIWFNNDKKNYKYGRKILES